MMQSIEKSVSVQHEQQLTSLVMDSIAITTKLFHEAKKPGFTTTDWAPLAAMMAVKEFKWISPEHEELGWQEYTAYLTEWAQAMSWKSTVNRIHQWQNIVYVEHQERCTFGDTVDICRSVAVYEFNEASKITRLAIYLQHKPSLGL